MSNAQNHLDTCTSTSADCFQCQTSKLILGLYNPNLETKMVVPEKSDSNSDDQKGIVPRMWRSLIVKDHKEFSSNQQQDAYEFYQYLLKTMQQKERVNNFDPTKLFEFQLQQRLQCTNCKQVKYSVIKNQTEISLPIPYQLPNIEGEKPADRAKREAAIFVEFDKCLEQFVADESINDFFCPSCQQKTVATK